MQSLGHLAVERYLLVIVNMFEKLSSKTNLCQTTLLNVLAGSIKKGSLKLFGKVIKSNFKPIFIQQEDLLFAQLTVKETLTTASSLKSFNNQGTSLNNVEENVNNTILKLGLKKVTNIPVGDAKTRGYVNLKLLIFIS